MCPKTVITGALRKAVGPSGGRRSPPLNMGPTYCGRSTPLAPNVRTSRLPHACRRQGCAFECVIMPRALREQLWNRGDTEWELVAGYSDTASAARQDRVRVKPKRTSFRPTNGRARPGLARMVRLRE